MSTRRSRIHYTLETHETHGCRQNKQQNVQQLGMQHTHPSYRLHTYKRNPWLDHDHIYYIHNQYITLLSFDTWKYHMCGVAFRGESFYTVGWVVASEGVLNRNDNCQFHFIFFYKYFSNNFWNNCLIPFERFFFHAVKNKLYYDLLC